MNPPKMEVPEKVKFTSNALILLKYFPNLITPSSDKTLNLFDIINLASRGNSITNAPLLPYESIGSLYSKEIKQMVGNNFSREMTKMYYNILNCLANYYQAFSYSQVLSLIKSTWTNLKENIDIEALYFSIYKNPLLDTIPWIDVFSQCQSFVLNKDNALKIIDKLALSIGNLDYTLQTLPVIESRELWKRKLTEEQKHILIETYLKASGRRESLDNIINTPFFINSLDIRGYDLNHKLSGIIATEIYSNELEGGLSPEQILTSPFIYLTHASHLEYLEQILLSNYLNPTPLREDQFPGVYLYPNIQNKQNAYGNTGLEVIFIVSLSLLKSQGWHISKEENYGNISSLTWSCNTLPEYLNSHYANTPFGEFVAHYPIPLDYVEEIIAKDNVINEVKRIVNNRFPVYSLTEFKQLPLTKRVKSLYLNSTYSDRPPNFCYSNLGGCDEPIVLPMKNIENILLNCGHDRNTVSNLIATKSYKELIQIVKINWTSKSSQNPQVYPPY